MACYRPLTAYRTVGGEVVFRERGDILQTLELPCGQCIGCRLERSRQWAIRIMHEAQCWDRSLFVTLTYAEAPPKLVYSHFQKFMKRLRRHYDGRTIRFFVAGEYGEALQRPHFHACLFNLELDDLKRWNYSSGSIVPNLASFGYAHDLQRGGVRAEPPVYWISQTLERLWGHGFCLVGELTFESAAYCARYIVDKVTGDESFGYYAQVDPETGELTEGVPEFCQMSRRPGIGYNWLQRFKEQAYSLDRVVVRGVPCQVPRYYLRKCEDDLVLEEIKYKRYLTAQERKADNTPERLAVREKVAKARNALNKRRNI